MTALDLGTQRNSIRALAQLVEATREGHLEQRVVERPVLRVEHNLRYGVRYGMFFGAGTIYRATQLVHRIFPRGRAQGVFGGTLVTAALLGRLATARDPGQILAPDKARVAGRLSGPSWAQRRGAGPCTSPPRCPWPEG